jgi:hypothetical protein
MIRLISGLLIEGPKFEPKLGLAGTRTLLVLISDTLAMPCRLGSF